MLLLVFKVSSFCTAMNGKNARKDDKMDWHGIKSISCHMRCSLRKDVPRNFAKFTGRHFCQSLLPVALLKKRLWHRCFPVNFAKFLRTPLGDCFCNSAAEKKLHTLTVINANDIQYHIFIWNQYVTQCPVKVLQELKGHDMRISLVFTPSYYQWLPEETHVRLLYILHE